MDLWWCYDGIRYSVLIAPEKYDTIYNRIRYLIDQKSCIKHNFSQKYAKIKIDSYDSLPLGKTLTLFSVIIPIKSILKTVKVPSIIATYL